MFAKVFKTKSNTAIKGSDRRKLRADINSSFPSLTTENLAELMPSKEELNVVKIYTHKGDAVTVYVQNHNPIMFELDRNLYPSVYTLWRYPDLLPAFTTWMPVLEKLAGGADLMLPGVVVPSSGLPEVKRGTLCAVTVVGNRAPVAVGVATMSTKEMQASGMKGKGINILHTYRDQLWVFGDKSSPPSIAPLEVNPAPKDTEEEQDSPQESEISKTKEVSLPEVPERELETLNLTEQGTVVPQNSTDKVEDEDEDTEDMGHCQRSPQVMDSLLNQCFFHALKYKMKKPDLPLLTSTFLRNYLYPCCPEGQQVDIKKSSYKKLSKFLQTMQQRKILQVKELTKGVESIVDIDWKHPDIRSFLAPVTEATTPTLVENESEAGDHPYQPPEITSLYGISAKMLPLFQDTGHRKGNLLTQSDVRSIIITYVKTNELVDPDNKNFVKVNPILCDCLLDKSEYNDVTFLKWDDLLTRCLERMQHSHQITFPGSSPIVRKGNIDPIDISVAQRGSNKKVTMIKNLELYGMDPSTIANLLQQRVQASATCTPLPGAKDRVQVQIQGNQVLNVGRLLIDDFKIPRKYVNGLDLATKPGKKK
ncbi:eukaryotic translation initiation factor 2D [Pelobates cultripes]|uniref:Eukaryotic translation initiation factor 2D n=1 Tax=Pelobates cultripes TaxID=61616 RepID=A0AAD1R061_PELCU|nr:eukaryotic translation initiation factor 2D [Pelobates cultripes]